MAGGVGFGRPRPGDAWPIVQVTQGTCRHGGGLPCCAIETREGRFEEVSGRIGFARV